MGNDKTVRVFSTNGGSLRFVNTDTGTVATEMNTDSYLKLNSTNEILEYMAQLERMGYMEITILPPSKDSAMTKQEYLKFHQECCKKMVDITKRKNEDYTGATDDPFKNFRRRGTLGFLVRMDDKLSRLESYIEKGSYEVNDESFEDTCLDLANYAILLAGYVRTVK